MSIEVKRVRGRGWRRRWSASVQISSSGRLTVERSTRRRARAALVDVREFVQPPMRTVPCGQRPAFPLLGQRISETVTGFEFEYTGSGWRRVA